MSGAPARACASLPRPAATAAGNLAAVVFHFRFWYGKELLALLCGPAVLLVYLAHNVFYSFGALSALPVDGSYICDRG